VHLPVLVVGAGVGDACFVCLATVVVVDVVLVEVVVLVDGVVVLRIPLLSLLFVLGQCVMLFLDFFDRALVENKESRCFGLREWCWLK